jgi:hypothetical protein
VTEGLVWLVLEYCPGTVQPRHMASERI